MEPIGPREIRQQLAHLCASLANRWRQPRTMPYALWQFMLHTPEEAQKGTVQTMVGMLRGASGKAQKGRPKYKRRKKVIRG